MSSVTGTLYLVPTPLDFSCENIVPITDVLPLKSLQIAAQLNHWIVENAKSARAFLKRVDEHYQLSTPIQQQTIHELERHAHKKSQGANVDDFSDLLASALIGQNIGLMSEAGMPAIADPGALVVRCAHSMNIPVVPLVGPSSLLLALAASGLNGQSFAFVGYVPAEESLRIVRLRQLEKLSIANQQTQMFIETPYRNIALLKSIVASLNPNMMLSTASGLTLDSMKIHSGTIAMWRSKKWEILAKVPTVFTIGSN
jgi:16S rRNA (cytidine1402-2'-O)-methyltransferase